MRFRRWAAPVAGGVVAALYLAYVVHFSTNVPLADDWSSVALVHEALHGDLSWGLLGPNTSKVGCWCPT